MAGKTTEDFLVIDEWKVRNYDDRGYWYDDATNTYHNLPPYFDEYRLLKRAMPAENGSSAYYKSVVQKKIGGEWEDVNFERWRNDSQAGKLLTAEIVQDLLVQRIQLLLKSK